MDKEIGKWKSNVYRDFKWEYVISGESGHWLLALPGGTRHPGLGIGFLEDLVQSFRIISPAYPRIGRMQQLAEGIAQILQQEAIQKVHVLGSSFGGIMAQEFFLMYPNLVEKIVISNTNTTNKDQTQSKKIRNARKILKLVPAQMIRSNMKKQFGKLMDVLGDQKPHYEAQLLDLIKARKLDKPDILCHFDCLIDFQRHNLDEESTSAFQSKMLIISAGNDTGVGKNARENLHRVYPRAKFFHFEDGGHFPMIIHKTQYMELIKAFLLE
ncbi:MAG: alpha/beta fold hydrolase [Candidatus Hodarchaeota archaeon]